MATIQSHTIFTNVALTGEGDVWWEGLTPKNKIPSDITDFTGQKWTPDCGRPAAHYNSRYLVEHVHCPVMDPECENPNGIPISAFIFGSRRKDTVPLVFEASNWVEGIIYGLTTSTDSKIDAQKGEVNYDPFGMRSYLGTNLINYLVQWLDLRQQLGYNIPKIFGVNWFREDDGAMWPGFGENSRLLKWMCQRIESDEAVVGPDHVTNTPLGFVPTPSALDLEGLSSSSAQDNKKEALAKLLHVNREEWRREVEAVKQTLSQYGDLPTVVLEALDARAKNFSQ